MSQLDPQLHVRMPGALHRQLQNRAEQEGISTNRLLVLLVAGGLGFALDNEETGRPNVRPPAATRRDLDEQQATA
jgi:hypothetical protein